MKCAKSRGKFTKRDEFSDWQRLFCNFNVCSTKFILSRLCEGAQRKKKAFNPQTLESYIIALVGLAGFIDSAYDLYYIKGVIFRKEFTMVYALFTFSLLIAAMVIATYFDQKQTAVQPLRVRSEDEIIQKRRDE